MGDTINLVTNDFIKIHVSNSKNNTIAFEKRFPKNLTIHDFKVKLEVLTGGNANTMQLELYNGDKFLTKLNENDRMLGYYPIENGMRVHVIDNFTYIDENIEKFELTTQQYENRSDTLKNFLKSNRLGKYDEEEMKKLEEKRKEMIEKEIQLAELCKVGLRCQVTTKGQPKRIGTIMFNGLVEAKKGILVGVKFDEPLGVNDGTIDGKRYFECPPKYGSFVQPSAVEVGDFPPEDYELYEI